jgi:hypothetical protein
MAFKIVPSSISNNKVDITPHSEGHRRQARTAGINLHVTEPKDLGLNPTRSRRRFLLHVSLAEGTSDSIVSKKSLDNRGSIPGRDKVFFL